MFQTNCDITNCFGLIVTHLFCLFERDFFCLSVIRPINLAVFQINKGNGGGVFANADLEVKRGKEVVAKLTERQAMRTAFAVKL